MLRKSAMFTTRDGDSFFICVAEEPLKLSASRHARNLWLAHNRHACRIRFLIQSQETQVRSFSTPARRTFFMLALTPVFLFQALVAGATGELIVDTTGGSLNGATRALGGAEFLGIPYAQPPVGDLRWREPLPAKPWTGVREATTFGAPCAQAILGD